ncbi:sigma-70 family RNA polymerase sigma factor [bacterium]|nr:sigma-70 family RNA polymerase sigma factor [bacterium]
MELSQEQLDLIKQIIKSDKKFQNNEDLFEDFFNETCKRSLSIVETMDDSDVLEAYLRKIVSTSIVVVLKNMGRVRRTHQSYVNNDIEVSSQNLTEAINDNKLQPFNVNYDFINIKTNPEEIAVEKELLQSVYDSVVIAHSQNVEKQYLQLYELRYVEGRKQADIAREMNISQSQVSKRLFELMEAVKNFIS